MPFATGQVVVWSYRRHMSSAQMFLVDADVIYDGRYRTRIRVHLPDGSAAYRWVHPKNLRIKRPDEPAYRYPGAP